MSNSVRIGEIGIGVGDQTLRTLLGSCVGVVLYDQHQKTAGLVHIQLPDSGGRIDPQPGRYADTAIPELISQIQRISKRPFSPIAHVAGGADMFASSRTLTVGQLNIRTVDALLSELRIPVLSHHCGGTLARRMTFEIMTGTIQSEVLLQPKV